MKIGIYSLGLIGGSLLKALSAKNISPVCVTRNQNTISAAKKYCTSCSDDISDLSTCDIVFVCSPISVTEEVLAKLENIVSPNCIVADTASVKKFVMKKSYKYRFIGSHPMAGLEVSGYESSCENLFNGAKWVLTPSDRATKEDLDKLKSIIELTGAQTLTASAQEHDMAVAYISHLPMLISQGLVKNTKQELAKKLASSGFRDTTRLAMTNKTLASDMLKYNKENILKAFEELVENTGNLLSSQTYCSDIEEVINLRKSMYSGDGKNIYQM